MGMVDIDERVREVGTPLQRNFPCALFFGTPPCLGIPAFPSPSPKPNTLLGFWGATSRISYTVSGSHHSNPVYRSPLTFGNEIEVYHSYLGNGSRELPLGFGIPNVGGGVKLGKGNFYYAGYGPPKISKYGDLS
jgi:hypothetical protein